MCKPVPFVSCPCLPKSYESVPFPCDLTVSTITALNVFILFIYCFILLRCQCLRIYSQDDRSKSITDWKGCGRMRSWPNYRYYSQHLPGKDLGKLRKISLMTIGALAEILTWLLSDISQNHFRLDQFARC
jgi:hypothetical protein